MPKRKKTTVRRKKSAFSSPVDHHPLFTALFFIFAAIIVLFAVFALMLHKAGEQLDNVMVQGANPTPTVYHAAP